MNKLETHRKTQAITLKNIVNSVYELDLMDKCRRREYTDARLTFMSIMYDEGYGYTAIGRMIGKNHATIIHCLKSLDWMLKNEKSFISKYHIVKEVYNSHDMLLEHKSSLQLKNLLILANNQIKMLNLDNASLKDECKSFREREGRFSSLFELITERTKDKDIPVIHRKLNTIYNGL
jgi:hypothetical protein